MPRYFFQISNGELVPDLDGVELPDRVSARHAAIDMLAEQLKGSGKEFWESREWRLDVADSSGVTVATLIVTHSDLDDDI